MTGVCGKSTAAWVAACGVAVALSGVFALWPLKGAEAQAPVIARPEPVLQRRLAALDQSAFRVPIWVTEASPPPPPAPPKVTPPPPIRLQLLAIVKEDGAYKAAVYDPESDRLLVVGAGESIGLRSVDKVGATSVSIRDGASVRTLALKEAKEDAP